MPPSFVPWALFRQKCQPRLDVGPGELGPQALSVCCSHRYCESFFFGLTGGVWWAGLWALLVSYPHTRPEPFFLCSSLALIKVSLHFLVQNSHWGALLGPLHPAVHQSRATNIPLAVLSVQSSKSIHFPLVLKKSTVLGGSSSLVIVTLTWVFSFA